MRYPNLYFATRDQRYADWEIARKIGLTPWAYSRRKVGQVDFTDKEKLRIAQILRFDEAWLFSRPELPARSSMGSLTAEMACAGADK